MKKLVLSLSSTIVLSGCFAGAQDFPKISLPDMWGQDGQHSQNVTAVEVQSLDNWWKKFGDPALNTLIELAMADSPDRKIAEARILEARGLKRTTRSALFPQIGASASGGRQDQVSSGTDDFYDARFDASYELDIFGVNRKAVNAAEEQIQAREASYHDTTLTLIADVARTYINYRTAQKQSAIAQKNLMIQEKTLELIKVQFEYGEAPRLDVERAETIVNTTKASIPEFERVAENAKLQLTVLTGKLPEELAPVLKDPADIPAHSATAVLMAPAKVLALRPDIRAASKTLAASTSLAESVTATLFPSFSISGFYGISESALTSATSVWSIALGAAVAVLDFGRIEGQIDAARAVESQAYHAYRKTVLAAVVEVETALNDTAKINEQRVSLQSAYDNARQAFELSETLYKEGEISFLDVLDAQRTVNDAEASLIAAEGVQAESVIRLYKSLGVY